MKKVSIILLILFLIFFTTLVKNSTKRIDDKIFVLEENIRSFKKEFEKIKLEYDYLSSAEKLLEFQKQYFEDELIKRDIKDIRKLNQNFDKFENKLLNIIDD